MARGRPRGTAQITKTKNWEFISDSHKCLGCGKTKHEGVNFRVNQMVGYLSVERNCNPCRLGNAITNKKAVKLPKTKKQPPVSSRIKNYFESQDGNC